MPKKSRAQWDALIEGLHAYYAIAENAGTVPPRPYFHETEAGVRSNVGTDLNNFRARGIPKDCPPDVRDVIAGYRVIEFSNPKGGSGRSRVQWDAFVEGLYRFYETEANLGTVPPHSYFHETEAGVRSNIGTDLKNFRANGIPKDCPPDVRDAIAGYSVLDFANPEGVPGRSRVQWDAFVEGLDKYFEVPENWGTVPPGSYFHVTEAGVRSNVGADIRNFRANGAPKSCPPDVRDVIEMYGVIDLPNPRVARGRSRAQWDAFVEGLDKYFEVPENLGTVPTFTYFHVTGAGVRSNVGVDLNNFRANGIPKDCPPDVREVIEGYRVTAFRNPIGFRPKRAVGAVYGNSSQYAGPSVPEDLVGSSVGGSLGSGQWEVPLVGSAVGQWAQWTLPPGGGPSVAPGVGSSGQAVQMSMPAEPTHKKRRVSRRG
ncbi:hypothetical protein ACFC09_26370 [Streptomyces sp. NPDC056161]|uniref:hypothetical protein n=1 Tax=Streptomyces sp. NPDC056161 TaxID=3345732 RepID=UPI0035E2DCDA